MHSCMTKSPEIYNIDTSDTTISSLNPISLQHAGCAALRYALPVLISTTILATINPPYATIKQTANRLSIKYPFNGTTTAVVSKMIIRPAAETQRVGEK